MQTERLTLRPATAEDLEAATWAIRRLDAVNQWITRAPQAIEEYEQQFTDPASLARSLIIELDGDVIGDLMVSIGDAWAQPRSPIRPAASKPTSAGPSTPTTRATADRGNASYHGPWSARSEGLEPPTF